MFPFLTTSNSNATSFIQQKKEEVFFNFASIKQTPISKVLPSIFWSQKVAIKAAQDDFCVPLKENDKKNFISVPEKRKIRLLKSLAFAHLQSR